MIKQKIPYLLISLILSFLAHPLYALQVTLEWEAPSTTIDGTAITDLSGFLVYYGTESGVYTKTLNNTDTEPKALIPDLEYNKTYYFSVRACTSNALESDYSEELIWHSPLMPDEDSDAISDAWELAHFAMLNAANSQSDSDADGMTDADEFIAGTDPLAGDKYPVVDIAIPVTGAVLTFVAQKTEGDGYENRERYYTLKRCTDLSAGIWDVVPGFDNILAMNQIVSFPIDETQQSVYYSTSIRLE